MTNSSGGIPVRLIELGLASAAATQAVYHAVAQRLTAQSPDTVILIRPRDPYLCLGWHDVMASVLDTGACEREGLPIFRRRVGGGTTYLDSSQPFYQFVFHHSHVPERSSNLFAYLLAAPVLALRKLGFAAELRAVNEIEVAGRRIAGVGGGRIGEAAVVVGNVLCDFDFTVLPRVWNAPWPRFREIAAQALGERLTTIRQIAGRSDPEAVSAAVKACLPEALRRPLQPGTLEPEEIALAARLERQLAAPEFLSLHADRGGGPMRRLKIATGVFVHGETATVGESILRATLLERDGVIESAHIEGGAAGIWCRAADALVGTPIAGWRERLVEADPQSP